MLHLLVHQILINYDTKEVIIELDEGVTCHKVKHHWEADAHGHRYNISHDDPMHARLQSIEVALKPWSKGLYVG